MFSYNNTTSIKEDGSSSSSNANQFIEISPMSSAPPSKEMKLAMIAVPFSMSSSKGSKGKGKGKKGSMVAKIFNPTAGRPYPTNKISLEQSIRVELMQPVTTFSTSVAVGTYDSVYIALGSFPGYVPFTAVFDQYRVDQAEIWIEPSIPASSGVAYPYVATCVDLDDANTPTTIASVIDHQGAILTVGSNGHYHKWKPHMAVAAFSGTFTSYSNVPASWCDCASPNIQHYGFKIAAYPTPAGIQNYLITLRAVFSFRSPGIS